MHQLFKYRHEYVMIINLYILSHILYDRHLYECILWDYCAYLKEVWDFTQPIVELIAIVQPASVQMLQIERGTTMYLQA